MFVPALTSPMGELPALPSVTSLLSAAAAAGSLWVDLPSPEGPEAPATVWMDLPRLEIAPRAVEAPLWPAALDEMAALASAASLLRLGLGGAQARVGGS